MNQLKGNPQQAIETLSGRRWSQRRVVRGLGVNHEAATPLYAFGTASNCSNQPLCGPPLFPTRRRLGRPVAIGPGNAPWLATCTARPVRPERGVWKPEGEAGHGEALRPDVLRMPLASPPDPVSDGLAGIAEHREPAYSGRDECVGRRGGNGVCQTA